MSPTSIYGHFVSWIFSFCLVAGCALDEADVEESSAEISSQPEYSPEQEKLLQTYKVLIQWWTEQIKNDIVTSGLADQPIYNPYDDKPECSISFGTFVDEMSQLTASLPLSLTEGPIFGIHLDILNRPNLQKAVTTMRVGNTTASDYLLNNGELRSVLIHEWAHVWGNHCFGALHKIQHHDLNFEAYALGLQWQFNSGTHRPLHGNVGGTHFQSLRQRQALASQFAKLINEGQKEQAQKLALDSATTLAKLIQTDNFGPWRSWLDQINSLATQTTKPIKLDQPVIAEIPATAYEYVYTRKSLKEFGELLAEATRIHAETLDNLNQLIEENREILTKPPANETVLSATKVILGPRLSAIKSKARSILQQIRMLGFISQRTLTIQSLLAGFFHSTPKLRVGKLAQVFLLLDKYDALTRNMGNSFKQAKEETLKMKGLRWIAQDAQQELAGGLVPFQMSPSRIDRTKNFVKRQIRSFHQWNKDSSLSTDELLKSLCPFLENVLHDETTDPSYYQLVCL